MQDNSEPQIMAVYCDFENLAIGARDAKFKSFDIATVLERLLLKGNIVVKKAYCDWDRYKQFKKSMHEAAFEMIEIPHVSQSGKNSADIRMVVDALDLCYTKAHVNVFVVISGDSDFSPLVSKLRENNKTVIGVGVKNSTSQLFVANCDDFIFYDDLVREKPERTAAKKVTKKRRGKASPSTNDRSSSAASGGTESAQQAIDLVVATFEELLAERGEDHEIWGSMIKQALKRRDPGFSEIFYGFRSFNRLLEEARTQGAIDLELDERSGGYRVTSAG